MTSNTKKPTLPDYTVIVQKIWRIVQDDDLLEAYDLIPKEEMSEDAPDPLKYEQHNLGLECWYVKPLFLSVYPKLFQGTLDTEMKKAYLTTALLLNCNVKSFWNMRRELVLQNQLDEALELRFVNLILSFWRKCVDAMNYRKWLLKDKLAGKSLKFLVDELNRIEDIADHHRKNNHLPWDYSAWLHDQCQFHPEFAAFTYCALHVSSQYMCSHPSDASHMNYRQQIIRRVIQDRDRLKDAFLDLAKKAAVKEGFTDLSDDDSLLIGIIMHEIFLNMGLMSFWFSSEGMWSYFRFLTWCWLKELPNLVSQQGKTRIQQLASSSENACPFRTYFFSRIQPKYLKLVKGDSPCVGRFKKWIDVFL